MPPQIPTWIGMYFVVAFSSCLDVAAIQMDLGEQLDFNRELTTVGISNVLGCVIQGGSRILLIKIQMIHVF